FSIVLIALVLVLGPLFEAVPRVLAIVAAASGLIVAVALPEWIQNTVAGLALSGRGQFREGDQIEVRDAKGTVDRVGLQRTRLRADDGSVVSLPNRDILQHAIRVGGQQSAVSVHVVLAPDLASTPAGRERALEVARMSPYRRARTAPRLED